MWREQLSAGALGQAMFLFPGRSKYLNCNTLTQFTCLFCCVWTLNWHLCLKCIYVIITCLYYCLVLFFQILMLRSFLSHALSYTGPCYLLTNFLHAAHYLINISILMWTEMIHFENDCISKEWPCGCLNDYITTSSLSLALKVHPFSQSMCCFRC